MDQTEHPDLDLWQARQDWFESLDRDYSRRGAPAPSEQACALMVDLQAVFCVGAWAAVIVLAAAIIECQSRHVAGRPDCQLPGVSTKDRKWLYHLRNQLVHERQGEPILTMKDQWMHRPDWEQRARRAVEMAFQSLHPPVDPA